jgi:hypothetical protein
MAEFRVYNGIEPGEPVRFPEFDPGILCDMMECLHVPFEEVKCSRDLGYGRIKASEMSITVLQDGRVNMRRVASKDLVSEIFEKIERVIIGAVVCECCGCDLLSILAGCTIREVDPSHPVFDAGSSFSLEKDIARRPLTRGNLESAVGSPASMTMDMLDLLHDQLLWEIEQCMDGAPSQRSKEMDSDKARCIVAELMQSDACKGKETIVLKALSLLRTVLAGLDGIKDVAFMQSQLGEDEHRIVQSYIEQVMDGVLTEVMPDTDYSRVMLSYAHLNKVNNAVRMLNRWDHS